MAQSVSLFLKSNGADIQGESTMSSMGRENSIECLYFEQSVQTAREKGTGMATGRRQYDPLMVRKRIDKSTPLLWKSLVQNEVIEGIFKFYRPNPLGDGTTQHFFTIEIGGGRIASIKDYVQDVIVPATANDPPLEEVSFLFSDITWTIEDGGITHNDSWKQQT
jgi:type VI secretion system secreted protein Hcp